MTDIDEIIVVIVLNEKVPVKAPKYTSMLLTCTSLISTNIRRRKFLMEKAIKQQKNLRY